MVKRFYTTIVRHPTLYTFLAITEEDLIQWEYHLENPNMSVNPKIFQPTLLPPPLYSGQGSHHMHDSGESDDSSVCHTTNKTGPSICQVCLHTTNMTSPSGCQSTQTSVCHTVNMTSPSVCQFHDSSVCQPKHDSTWNSIWKAVCQSPILSLLPSAKFMVKMPTSVPVLKFPNTQYPGKLPSIHTSMDSSVNPSVSPSITSSLSAENPLKILCNNGEKHVVNYMHEIPVKSPSIHTMYGMSVIAPICALFIPSAHMSYMPSVIVPVCASPILSTHLTDDEHQKFPDELLIMERKTCPKL